MTNKFKVGDKVRLIKNGGAIAGFTVGETVTIRDLNNGGRYIITIINGDKVGFVNAEQIIPVEFTIDDLQNGDVVTLRNGDKLVYVKDRDFEDLTTEYTNDLTNIWELTDNLEYDYCDEPNKDYDIIKVERPTYTTVFERDEEVKEMTIAEISKALGYEVKIVKEEER